MFKGFMKHLFGVRYGKAVKGTLACLLVYLGLCKAGISISIAPSIMYLMAGTVTMGAIWRDLAAKDQMLAGKNLFMLPFSGWELIVSYVGVLGIYTLVVRTGLLLAVVLAVSSWKVAELAGCLLCAVYGILASAWCYGEKEHRKRVMLWNGGMSILALWLSKTWIFYAILIINSFAAIFFLRRIDAYAFYEGEDSFSFCAFGTGGIFAAYKRWKDVLIWKYFFRYLWLHKNYLINILLLWGVAAGMPLILGQIERNFALSIGCALLTLNTPVGILLSGEPDLEQAVRTLPGQERSFLFPYGSFLFFCNLMGDFVFLCSFWVQRGWGCMGDVCLALIFSAMGAVGSALMEWYFPIHGWKTQSDLWHHPRKYVVPGSLLLLSGIMAELFY